MDNDIVYDLLKELKEDFKEANKYVREDIKGLHESVSELKIESIKNSQTLELNTSDIAEHIRRCDALEESNLLLNKRIDELQKPLSAKELFMKTGVFIVKLSAVIGAAITAWKFFHS